MSFEVKELPDVPPQRPPAHDLGDTRGLGNTLAPGETLSTVRRVLSENRPERETFSEERDHP